MKRNLVLIAALSTALTSVFSMASAIVQPMAVFAESEEPVVLSQDENTGWYVYNADAAYPSQRANVLTPDFYVFAGKMDLTTANQIMNDMGIPEVLKATGGKVSFISPIEGDLYTSADLDAYEAVIKRAPINNIKMIGLNSGADFLNNIAAPKVNYVAGMLIIGGEMNSGLPLGEAIPVYLSNPSDTAADYFTRANAQSGPHMDLQRTVSAGRESLADSFSNAWNQVLKMNYRSTNCLTEFYNLPMLLDRSIDPLELKFDLTDGAVFEDLGIQYNQHVHEGIEGLEGDNYAWFEYIPAAAQNADSGTVPLIVSVHGNQNDPRLQGDSSGWTELAAREGFMVISPEYQGADQGGFFTQAPNNHIYGDVDGMGADGIPKLVKQLLKTYPQIDASRIYVTGLSLGGATTSYLGAQYPDIFAAAASVSGVHRYNGEVAEIAAKEDWPETAYMYICGDKDYFRMLPVDGTSEYGAGLTVRGRTQHVPVYPLLNAYRKLNGIEEVEMDMSKNPYFGMELDNWSTTTLGDRVMHEGTLSNEHGVVMKLAAIEDQAHWNYKPQAEYIWDFFQDYARNPETHELIYVQNVEPEPDPEPTPEPTPDPEPSNPAGPTGTHSSGTVSPLNPSVKPQNPSAGEGHNEAEPGWKQSVVNGSTIWQYYKDGRPVSGLQQLKWGTSTNHYLFDADGRMLTGWHEIEGPAGSGRYYFDHSGAMKKNWLKADGTWYYLGSQGRMQTGKVTDKGNVYLLKADGRMHTGWNTENNEKYYYDHSGAMKKGWLNENGTWYFFRDNGTMAADTHIGIYQLDSQGKCLNPND